MILFQLTLSPAQINTLRFIAAGGFDNKSDLDLDSGSHFLTSSKSLLREGLIKWHPNGNMNGRSTNPKGGPRWEVTHKGELVLEVIAIEIDDMKSLLPHQLTIESPRKKRK